MLLVAESSFDELYVQPCYLSVTGDWQYEGLLDLVATSSVPGLGESKHFANEYTKRVPILCSRK